MSWRPRILIVGDGVAAWLTAAILARRLGPDYMAQGDLLSVVPACGKGHGLGPFGDALIGHPEWQIMDIARSLPADLLQRHAALSYSLGIAYTGWGAGGAPWFLPFGDCGAPIGAVPFLQVAARARLAGRRVRLADYSLAALAAQAERFAYPETDRHSPRSTLAFASHLQADGLAAVLRGMALHLGVCETNVPFRNAVAGPQGLAGLVLEDGCQVAADIFVDATGGQQLMAGPGGWESWSHLLPCDAVRTLTEPEQAAPPPYALMTATATGWTATIPLAGKRAVTELVATLGGPLPEGATRFDTGVATEPWRGNVVGVGASALLIEPLLGTSLLTATTAVERLADLLPHAAECQAEATEYNRRTRLEAHRLRDMVLALWRTNGRTGEALWDRARAKPGPDELERKLALYASRGLISMEDGELFEAADWALLLDGQGVHPRRHDPLAGALSLETIDRHLARLRDRLIAEVRSMPTHAAMLAGSARS